MQSDVSFERRLRYQDMAITRLMCETRLLRDENAELVAQLEMARNPCPDAKVGRLEATLPPGPDGPATARAALTRWFTGQVPGDVLADVRLLSSGYGLQLVEALASRWGVDDADGARLWFEVDAA